MHERDNDQVGKQFVNLEYLDGFNLFIYNLPGGTSMS